MTTKKWNEVTTPIGITEHVAATDPHTGYRLESADHTHQTTGAQAGQLDHGLALTGLTDDDHTQYVLESLYDAYSILMATTDNTPAALTVDEQTLVGRKTGGIIAALAGADALLAMGITPTVTELNYVDGVTSAIQTQLGLKAPLDSPTFTTPALGAAVGTSLQLSGLTASEILGTDASKNLVSLAVATYPSLTELSYVKGLSSAIQTQMNLKSPLISPSFTGTVTLPAVTLGGAVNANSQAITGAASIVAGQLRLGTYGGSDWVTLGSDIPANYGDWYWGAKDIFHYGTGYTQLHKFDNAGNGAFAGAVTASSFTGGDFIFKNKWRLTEAEELGLGEGIALVRPDNSVSEVFN